MDRRTLAAAGAAIAVVGASAVALYNQFASPKETSSPTDEKHDFPERPAAVNSTIVFAINGERHEIDNPDPSMTLSDYLRQNTRLTGTKIGCGEGGCGACAVLLQGVNAVGRETAVTVNACLRPLAACDGYAITTTEGLGCQAKGFHPVQERVAKFGGSQCGFCTPGMVMALYGALRRGGSAPTAEQVERSLDGNLCRCTGYRPILDAGKSFSPDGNVKDHVTGGAAPTGPYDASRDPPFPEFLRGYHRGALRTDGPLGTWLRPASLSEALRMLAANPRAKAVVANTSAGIFKGEAPSMYLDLGALPELRGHREGPNGLHVGAAESIATLSSLMESMARSHRAGTNVTFPCASAHLEKIASHHVRNVGSVAGNILMAKTRHFESDLVTVLASLGATVNVVSAAAPAQQSVDLLTFLAAPHDPTQLITSIFVPYTAAGEHYRSHKISLRPQNTHALVNAAFCVAVSEGAVTGARLVYGAVEKPYAVRATAAEAALVGQKFPLSDASLDAVLAAVARDIVIPSHARRGAYRQRLVANLLRRSLREMGGDAAIVAPVRAVSSGAQATGLGAAELEAHAPVSRPMPKVGAELQASGEAQFTDDARLASPLYAAFVLSSQACARVTHIDASEAEACPGVAKFYSAEDIPGKNDSGAFTREELFATTTLFAGHPVGMILADTPRQALYAAQKVKVDYESAGEPVFTSEGAKKRGTMFDKMLRDHKRGNFEAAFATTAIKAEGAGHSNTQAHFYMEPQTAWAAPDEDGMITIGASMQWPNGTQSVAARVLGIDVSKITAVNRRCGGGFGGKLTRHLPIVCAAALGARLSNRPVRMALDRSTDITITAGRHDCDFTYRVGFDAEGNISALQIHILMNAGCSPDISDFCVMSVARAVDQTYYVPNFQVITESARTDLPSRTAMRGPGEIQASFIAETIMTHVAMHLQSLRGPDAPLSLIAHDVRSRNQYPMDEAKLVCHDGKKIEHYTMPRVWAELEHTSDFAARASAVETFNRENKWRKRGIAMTPVKYYVAAGYMEAIVNVYEDGTVRVAHGGCEIGQGIHTKVMQAAAYHLSKLTDTPFPMENIRMLDTSTAFLPNMQMTGGSTTSEAASEAVRIAIEQLIERLRPVQALLIKKRAEKKGSEAPVAPTFVEIIKSAKGDAWNLSLSSHATFRRSSAEGHPEHGYYNFGAAASEVEVDLLTGETQILRTDIVYDCGKSLNPLIDLGQAEGGFVQGLGFYLREDLILDERGRVWNDGTWEYKPPCSVDIPVQFNVSLLKDSPYPKGILSSKASGEPPLVLATSVFVAIKHAIHAARADRGVTGNFRLDAPATLDVIQTACVS